MKVYIGPYNDRFSAYRLFDKYMSWKHEKPYWSVEDEEYTKTDKLIERFCDGLQTVADHTVNKIHSMFERKIKIRIDPYDTWSMDHTLALIIHPMLVQLKAANHGYFSSDPEDAPSIGAGDETDYGGNDTLALDRYNWIMDEMIWTFDELKSDRDHELFFNEETGEYNFEGQKEHDERIQNGLRLFGKYFRALWD